MKNYFKYKNISLKLYVLKFFINNILTRFNNE